MYTTRLYRFVVLFVVGMLCVTGLWSGSSSQSVAEAKPSVRRLDADSTDMMAHAAGSEWHDKSKSPLVVDFSPPSQTEIKSIGGMDQWLASQGQAVNASPRAAVTGKNRVLIIRVHFSDSTQRLSNAQLVTNWLEPLNTLFRTTSNGKNDGWDFDFYGPVNVSSRSTYVRPNNQMNDDSANNMQKLVDDVVDASDEDDLEPLLDQADTVILLMDNQSQARLRGVNSWNGREYDFGLFDEGDDIITIFMDEGGMCSGCTAADFANLDTYMWGVMAHELGHSLQAFKGGVHQKIEYAHPSNYLNAYELLDANYPGHVSAYLKTFTMEEWLPDSFITTVSNSGTQKPSDAGYCLRAIEYDPAVFATPQILKINITGSVWYLVSAHRKVNGDDKAPIPEEGILIERIVADGMTQWEDGDQDGVVDAGETITIKSAVRGFANAGGASNRDKLWGVGKTFNNSTDGNIAGDSSDGISISVLSNPNPDTWCVRVSYGPAANQPDVGIYPWRQPPGETYETTDIWVDSPLNGYNNYRYGLWNDLTGLPVPRGNGDDPAVGSINRIYARVRNFGTTSAANVKVQFKVTDPLGVGVQNTSWANVGAQVTSAQFPGLATIPPGGYVDVYTEWTPNPTLTPQQIADGVFYFHSCIRVEIATVAGESITGNQDGEDEQENIQNFEATPTRSPIFDHTFDIINSEARNRLINIFNNNNLPNGWQLSINGGNSDIPIPSATTLTVPISVTATGSSAIGSSFTVSLTAAEAIDLINPNARDEIHPSFDELGGFDFTVNVLADTSIACEAYIQSGRVSVVGTLDGFQGIHQAGTPLRAYAQLFDVNDNPIPLDDRATGDVGANGVFRMNFSYYRDNKGQSVPQIPQKVRCRFPGTHLLASSSTQGVGILNQAPPTATIVPWFASQFHSNLALNGFWPPFFPYGNFTCAFGRCPVLVAGTHGRGARMIDANSTMLQSTAPVNLGPNFTVSLWARRTRNNMTETLVSHGNSFLTGQLFNMGFTDTNQVVCSTFNDELLSSTVIRDRDWHHYACVVAGNQRHLYIDGALDSSRTAVVPNYAQNTTVYVGRRLDSARAFDGTIDEVRVHSSALNATRIGQLYANDPTFVSAPLASSSFDDVIIAESNGVFSYCANQQCPKVYYPDIYYPDATGNPTPTTYPATVHNRPHERFAAVYMEPNHPMSYGVAAAVTPYPGVDSSLMFWARLDDSSALTYPLVQSLTTPPVNRPSIAWTGASHALQYANLNYTWDDYDNKWHLFTFVKRGAMLELYIDNNLVKEEYAPPGLQPFRVSTGSTINVGGVSGGEVAAVELSPFAYTGAYIQWRYENGIPNPTPQKPTVSRVNTITMTPSMTPTGTFSPPTRTWYRTFVVIPTSIAVILTAQANQINLNNAPTRTAQALATQMANMHVQTATSIRRTQEVINNTETRLVATDSASTATAYVATMAKTVVATRKLPTIILPTIVFVGFPTLQPSYTNTRTATSSPTINPKFTATSSRTSTATRSFTATRSQTRSMTNTRSRTSTRTRISTPTFVTMTATVTMSPTAISTRFGPDTVFTNRLPAGMLVRALQFISDQRENSCSSKDIACPANDWSDPVISDIAIPFYRPDIRAGMVPAYYEITLADRNTKQPRGFIMMAVDYNKSADCVTNQNPACGVVDYPIAHWNSSGPAMSAQLTTQISTDGLSEYKLWKLDTLSYVAIQNNSMVGSVGAFPVLINNLAQSFSYYGNAQGDGDTMWSPANLDESDDRKPEDIMPEYEHIGISDEVADRTWQFNDVDLKNNFSQYVSKYSFSFEPLLNQLKQEAMPQWNNERMVIDPYIAGDASRPDVPRYNIAVQANSVTSVVLPFRGVTLNNITNESPEESRISFTLDSKTLSGYSILKITTLANPTDALPRLRLLIQMPNDVSVQGPYQNAAKFTFFLTDKVTQVCPAGDYCPLTTSMLSRGWAPWRSYWAGTGADQRNYNQFDVGGGCLSGCGPTAWMMLFGWVDYKSSPAPSYAASSVWPRRWNSYRAGGNNTGATIGSTGTAPQGMDAGVRNAVGYIRNAVDTFCFPLSSSGATVPWKMDSAANYLHYVGTSMSLDTHYNIAGAHEDRLTRYALESLSSSNPRPVVIGTGHLAHYPLAWGVQYTTRPEGFWEGWADGDDVVWHQFWYVNQGWGGNGNGWIQTGTWFAGRVNP